jgi:hypothetical protein
MKVSADVFGAFIDCPTKCWLRAVGEPTSGNAYAESLLSGYKSNRISWLVSSGKSVWEEPS